MKVFWWRTKLVGPSGRWQYTLQIESETWSWLTSGGKSYIGTWLNDLTHWHISVWPYSLNLITRKTGWLLQPTMLVQHTATDTDTFIYFMHFFWPHSHRCNQALLHSWSCHPSLRWFLRHCCNKKVFKRHFLCGFSLLRPPLHLPYCGPIFWKFRRLSK